MANLGVLEHQLLKPLGGFVGLGQNGGKFYGALQGACGDVLLALIFARPRLHGRTSYR